MKFLLFTVLFPLALAAQNVIVADPSFNSADIGNGNGDGFNSGVSGFMQSNGKTVLCGQSRYNGKPVSPIIRINPDGSIDDSFVADSIAVPNYMDVVTSLANGQFLVSGTFHMSNQTTFTGILRYNYDGGLDTSFSVEIHDYFSGAATGIKDIMEQNNGKIIVAGNLIIPGGLSVKGAIRLNQNGTVDQTYYTGTGAYNSANGGLIRAAVLQPDGKTVICGDFTSFDGVIHDRIVRLNNDGTNDTSFLVSGIGTGLFLDVEMRTDGKIILAGQFSGGLKVINQNGSIGAFSGYIGNGSSIGVSRVAVRQDGKIFITGVFSTVDGIPMANLARLNANGTIDTAFSCPLGPGSNVLYLIPCNEKLLICGIFNHYGYTYTGGIARINGDGSLDMTFNPGTGSNDEVITIKPYLNSKMLIAGRFTHYNGEKINCIAIIEETGQLDTNFNPGSGPQYYTSSGNLDFGSVCINALATQADGKILVGGIFDRFDDNNIGRLVRLNSDGSVDLSFQLPNPGITNSDFVNDILVQPDGKILVGRQSSSSYAIQRVNIDGTFDPNFYTLLSGSVTSIELLADGKILVGGQISYSNSTKNICRLNANGSIDNSFTVGLVTYGTVKNIKLAPDSTILVAGNFNSYNGVSSANLIQLEYDGLIDQSFSAPGMAYSTFKFLGRQNDGKIITQKTYSGNGQDYKTVTRLNQDGSIDNSFDVNNATINNFGNQAQNEINSCTVLADNRILVGGSFTSFGEIGRNRIMMLHECSPTYSSTTASFTGSYTWNGNVYTTSGQYYDTIVNSNGCDSIMELNLNLNNPLINVFTTPDSIGGNCNGSAYMSINLPGNFTFDIGTAYSNSSNSAFFDSLCPGLYQTTVTDPSGATYYAQFVVSINGNYYMQNTSGNQNTVDTLSTTIENCSIDYESILNIAVDSITIINNQIVVQISVIDALDTTTIEAVFSLPSDTGNYLLQLGLYCPEKSGSGHFAVFTFGCTYDSNGVGLGLTENNYGPEIYPNPTTAKVIISGSGVLQVLVLDTDGRELLTTNCQNNSEIDLSALSAGTYLLRIQTESTIITKKVIKQ